ncbi:glutamate receptor U1-like [Haemaphysalis longicornis]
MALEKKVTLQQHLLQESDITAHPVIPTPDRIAVGTPLPAYAYSNPRYYAGTRNPYMTSVFAYLMSFDLEVWLGLLLFWPLVSALLSFIEAVRSPVRFRDTITENLFDVLGIMMFEGTIRPVRDVVGRVVVSVWWLSALVLMNSFQGTMKASMSVKTPTARLETFRDLADRPHIKPILIRGTTFEHQFKVSPEPDLKKILSTVRAHQSILPGSVVFTRQTFDEILSGRAILFMEDNVIQSYVAALYPQKPGAAIIYPSRQYTISAQFGMFMRKDLDPRIQKLLHTRCRWLHESGLTERKRLQLQTPSWYLMPPESSPVRSLLVEDTAALFYMVLLAQSIAFVVFVGELLVHNFIRKRALRLHRKR